MLAKDHRLSKKDIELLFKQGEGFRTPFVFFRTRPTNIPRARFCIIFTKTVKMTSIERNRIRRLTYGVLQKYLEKFRTHRDYAVTITPKLIEQPQKKRREILEQSLTPLLSLHG